MSIVTPERTDAHQSTDSVSGEFVQLGGEDFYRLANFDRLPPFLMSIVSAGDLWMYVSSAGGLTAGRVSAENCLFPYETVDKLHDCHAYTGPFTLLRLSDEHGQVRTWQPMAGDALGQRNLFKHFVGDQLVFEEVRADLGLTFRYRWCMSTEFGFVRTATLENNRTEPVEVTLLDGLRNLMPFGLELATYQSASCLADAYKHNEIDPQTGMGIFSLTSKILDRAEAAEVLQATAVFSAGLRDCRQLLTLDQVPAFCRGEHVTEETISTGRRGNYLVSADIRLEAGESRSWQIVADVALDHTQLAQRRQLLLSTDDMLQVVDQTVEADHVDLVRNVASADGLQTSGNKTTSVHHFSNVLFNNMRGGVFADNYQIDAEDFRSFVSQRNSSVYRGEQTFLDAIPEKLDHASLIEQVRQQENRDLLRNTMEYLPLTFGRRHGDPSRPWNQFEIHTHGPGGQPIYNYQGNWRDIFQNWEALCQSFPLFLPSVVAKFVNASTVDGFNPYRITRGGIDWEVPADDDRWSNIGYWGDHQIVYLTKLLEATQQYFPSALCDMLEEPIFCYAQVPYRIKSYDDLVRDSRRTIQFDRDTAKEIDGRVDAIGADGKLVTAPDGGVYYVNLTEKLLVPALAKLSNFIVDGGIWLNTQRPEWNDANNALVGAGLSMVTVCYLHRYLLLLIDILTARGECQPEVSIEVEQWFGRVRAVLQENHSLLNEHTVSAVDRRRMVDELGRAFSDYRLKVYDNGFSGQNTIQITELIEFCRLALEYVEHAIRANRRPDGLYHAYNLLELSPEHATANVHPLCEMLEGQVAVLSAGLLDGAEVLELVDILFKSALYRIDQQSFVLYPDRQLAGFLNRNIVVSARVTSIGLLRELTAAGKDSIVIQDADGDFHFHRDLYNAQALERRLEQLAVDPHWTGLVAADRPAVLEVYEEVFQHNAYTGRSSTMYGYEGLGCIYWHMVSKLLLALQENFFQASDRKDPDWMLQLLGDAYYLVRGGLSSDKSPEQYGAFPTDPYSHTPKHAGAQQPGMTGQVKEEILTRRGELGVRVLDGRLVFQPLLLRLCEFLTRPDRYEYFDVAGRQQHLDLEPGSLAFTVCQVPIVYRLSNAPGAIAVTFADGTTESWQQDFLDADLSQKVFDRQGEVSRIDLQIAESQIVRP